MGKKIVCRCQDVTEDEIKDAIRQGYTDLESLKRFTGGIGR
jgi:bacterioferritin-associated ferredoxin